MSVGARTFLRQHLSVVARDRTVGREKNNDDLAALKIAANYEIFMNFVFLTVFIVCRSSETVVRPPICKRFFTFF